MLVIRFILNVTAASARRFFSGTNVTQGRVAMFEALAVHRYRAPMIVLNMKPAP
jgi:hypothetical protein